MSIQQYFVSAEAHCHENSLAYYCHMCNIIICSHCANANMSHDWSHTCVHDGITYKFEIDNDFDNDFDDDDDFDDEEESDDDQDYHLDNIASGGRVDNGPHFMSFSDRNI